MRDHSKLALLALDACFLLVIGLKIVSWLSCLQVVLPMVFVLLPCFMLNVVAFPKVSLTSLVIVSWKFNTSSCDMRNVSTSQLQQCAGSNVAGLAGTLLAFCLYCYNLSALPKVPCVVMPTSPYNYHMQSPFDCPVEVLEVSWLYSDYLSLSWFWKKLHGN